MKDSSEGVQTYSSDGFGIPETEKKEVIPPETPAGYSYDEIEASHDNKTRSEEVVNDEEKGVE